MSFVHLHTHSEYSLLDGANRISDLVAHVKRLGMDSLAVTDHGNMHAAWSFYEEAKAQQIRPILGFEAYLAYGPRQAREKPAWAPAAYSHLVLLARNRAGLPESGSPDLDRLHGGVLPAPADRQGSPLGARRRTGVSGGLPVRRGGDPPSAGALRGGAQERGMVRRDVRHRRLLARDPAARHRRRADRGRGDAPAGTGARTRRGRHQRRALSPPGRRRGARRAAGHRHR